MPVTNGVRTMKTGTLLRSLCCITALILLPFPVCAGQGIETIATRPGVTLKLLVMKPEGGSRQVMLMFPGGKGAHHFGEQQGQIRLGRNFLLRTAPDFVGRGFAVAVVDVPSDQASGMEDRFRTSVAHREDMEAVMQFLAGAGYESVYLVGTSRGTISVAYLGTAVKDERIKGIILTSTMSYSRHLMRLPLENTTHPVLLVHHQDDECRVTPFAEAQKLEGKFPLSPQVDFVPVKGGAPPQSDPCKSLSTHGFLGSEETVVQVIDAWIAGRKAP